MAGRLHGLVALVTGAGGGGGGGGAGIARRLGAEGAVVAVNDLREELAQTTVEEIRARGAEAFPVAGDVSDPQQAARMVQQVVDRYGRLDILVNNAAALGRTPAVERMPDDVWRQQIAVNLTGPFLMSRAALPHMIARGFGRIVNISSVAGIRSSLNGGAAYTASKSGLLGFTRQLAVEVVGTGVTVNVIVPANILSPEAQARMAAAFGGRAAGRRVDPEEELGGLVAFLALRESHRINGAAIPLEAGTSGMLGSFLALKRIGKDIGQ